MHASLRTALITTSTFVCAAAFAQEGDTDTETNERTPAIPHVAGDTPAGMFGAKGQITVSSDAGLSLENRSISGQSESITTLQLRPSIDYFIIDNLSFGGFLGLQYQATDQSDSTTFAIGPRFGYNIPLSPRWSIWPKAGLSFASTSVNTDFTDPTTGTTTRQTASATNIAVNLFAPVMFHPVEHFFLGLGPALDTDVSGDVRATTLAIRLTIGGYF